jgi:hypothetical protein
MAADLKSILHIEVGGVASQATRQIAGSVRLIVAALQEEKRLANLEAGKDIA